MDQNAKFWNRLAKRYAGMQVPDEASYREKLARTRAVLSPDARVLEIGCGTGSTALEHAPHVAEILATDFAPAMIDIAKTRAAAAGITNIRFRTAALEDISAQDGRFDAVLALNLVHLLAAPDAGLRRMAAMLEPGGVLILSTQCLADRMGWMRHVAPLLTAARVFPSLTFFRRTELERWLAEAGLTIEDAWQPKGFAKAVFHIARKT